MLEVCARLMDFWDALDDAPRYYLDSLALRCVCKPMFHWSKHFGKPPLAWLQAAEVWCWSLPALRLMAQASVLAASACTSLADRVELVALRCGKALIVLFNVGLMHLDAAQYLEVRHTASLIKRSLGLIIDTDDRYARRLHMQSIRSSALALAQASGCVHRNLVPFIDQPYHVVQFLQSRPFVPPVGWVEAHHVLEAYHPGVCRACTGFLVEVRSLCAVLGIFTAETLALLPPWPSRVLRDMA